MQAIPKLCNPDQIPCSKSISPLYCNYIDHYTGVPMNKDSNPKTHFGFQTVDWTEKAALVKGVFDRVSPKYDLMNDLMSFGVHRLWKQRFVGRVSVKPHAAILDVAGGTGDISEGILNRYRSVPLQLTLCDINFEMIDSGRDRALNQGKTLPITYVVGDGMSLPVPDNSQDVYTISFGLRNITDIQKALDEAYRVLKPGGQFLCLEFSKPREGLFQKAYKTFSFNVIPTLGEWIGRDRGAYQYLVESIERFPNQEDLKGMMMKSGFKAVDYENLTQGVAAIHQGWKPE